jgi:hypothetical protein
MLPIGHVPTQIYVNKTYIPHYNWAIIYIYLGEGFLLKNLVIFQTVNSKAIKSYPNVKKI